ncbi:hypothetical protein AB0M02_38975 [Actinoplanes sp. NPDC051861]|uniref:hypothetical protein n=1 Tax=Actinoplanes sp. NPDC051861 TaxID=3155170 RepID=UPI0034181DF1
MPDIVLTESYDYVARPGDAGAEYFYYVKTPLSSLPALVEHFETTPGEGNLETRLVAGLRNLVKTGELHAALDKEKARDIVAAHFRQAGVPAESKFSYWVNSDWGDD